jgi:hypothetical protein
VTATAATGLFIYGMINAGDEGWADLGTLLPIAAAIVLYGVFVVVERTVRNPLMHPSLLSRRPIAAGAFLMLVANGVLIAGLFLGSQYLQHFRGLSALETGLFFLPPALATMIGAIAAGRLVGRIGTRPVAVVGLILVAIGNALLIGLSADGNVYVEALPGVVMFALGSGPLFVRRGRGALATPRTVRKVAGRRHAASVLGIGSDRCLILPACSGALCWDPRCRGGRTACRPARRWRTPEAGGARRGTSPSRSPTQRGSRRRRCTRRSCKRLFT